MNEIEPSALEDFIECVKTRARPTGDIETCVRSSTTCLLANLSMRHKTWLDWDEKNWTVKQEARSTLPEGEVSLAVETGGFELPDRFRRFTMRRTPLPFLLVILVAAAAAQTSTPHPG
jgi:hypothetical protein